MQQLIQTASSVRLVIGGKVVGFATGLQFTRTQATKYIYEIDSPIAKEIMPTVYSVSGNLQGVRLRGSGGLDGRGIMDVSSVSKFFTQNYVNLEILDRVSGKTIYTIQKVMFDTDSWSITSRQLITFSASFKGTFVSSDEVE